MTYGVPISIRTDEFRIADEFPTITRSQPGSMLGNPLPFILSAQLRHSSLIHLILYVVRAGPRSRGQVVPRFHSPDVKKLRAALQEAVNPEQKLKIINDRQELTSEIEKVNDSPAIFLIRFTS
jgi:hypothetical protein